MSTPTTRIVITIPLELKAQIDTEAEQTCYTPSGLIVEITKNYFKGEGRRIPIKHDLRRALDELNNQT